MKDLHPKSLFSFSVQKNSWHRNAQKKEVGCEKWQQVLWTDKSKSETSALTEDGLYAKVPTRQSVCRQCWRIRLVSGKFGTLILKNFIEDFARMKRLTNVQKNIWKSFSTRMRTPSITVIEAIFNKKCCGHKILW